MNRGGVWGKDPGQSTITIQCKQKNDLKARAARAINEREKKNYWFFHKKASHTNDESTFRIDRGDLVFTTGTAQSPNTMNGEKTAVPVIATLNGLYTRKLGNETRLKLNEDSDERRINMFLSRSMRFIGVSLGWTNPTPDLQGTDKDQITVRVAGTGQVFNNGVHTIVPGDTLLWHLPDREDVKRLETVFQRYGRGNNKVVPIIMPLRYFHKEFLLTNLEAHFRQNTAENYGNNCEPTTSMTFSLAMKRFIVDLVCRSLIKLKSLQTDNEDVEEVDGERNLKVNKKTHEKIMDAVDKMYVNNLDPDNFEENARNTVKEIMEKLFSYNARDFEYLKDDLTNVLAPFLSVQDEIRRRTIGVALSYANVGEEVKVLINSQ